MGRDRRRFFSGSSSLAAPAPRSATVLLGLLALGALTWACPAAADSIFSANGLGELIVPTDVRGRGMGGTGIAIDTQGNLSYLNPAVLAVQRGFTLHGEGVPEFQRIEDDEGRVSTARSTNFPMFRAVVPVPRVGVFGVGFAQWSDVSYELTGPAMLDTLRFTRTLEGENGWNDVVASYARTLRPDLQVGLDVLFMIGSFVDVWTTTPEDPDLNVTVDSLVVNHSRGPLLRFGGLYTPTPRLRLGASYMPGRRLTVRTEVRSTRTDLRYPDQHLDLPPSVGVGASYLAGSHWLLASDLQWTGWEGTDLQLTRTGIASRNVTRIAVGAEYRSNPEGKNRSLLDRIVWRAGYSREPWNYTDPAGESIVDHIVSVGAGLPFPQDAGFLDLSIEAGTRGSKELNGVRERVLRIGVGISLREIVAIGRVE